MHQYNICIIFIFGNQLKKYFFFSRFYRCSKCHYPLCGEACENGNLHSKYECLLFQEAGYKVDTEDTNAAIQEALGDKERGKGEIFKDISSYRKHIQEGGFSPYCYISTIRCIMMKGNIEVIYLHISRAVLNSLERL